MPMKSVGSERNVTKPAPLTSENTATSLLLAIPKPKIPLGFSSSTTAPGPIWLGSWNNRLASFGSVIWQSKKVLLGRVTQDEGPDSSAFGSVNSPTTAALAPDDRPRMAIAAIDAAAIIRVNIVRPVAVFLTK